MDEIDLQLLAGFQSSPPRPGDPEFERTFQRSRTAVHRVRAVELDPQELPLTVDG